MYIYQIFVIIIKFIFILLYKLTTYYSTSTPNSTIFQMMARSKSRSTNVKKIASVKKLIVKKKKIGHESAKSTAVKAKCVCTIFISKLEKKTSVEWLNIMMNSFPVDELEKFYSDMISGGDEKKIDVVQLTNEYDKNETKLIQSLQSKGMSNYKPYRQLSFFGHRYEASWNYLKPVFYEELSRNLESTYQVNCGRHFFDLGFDLDEDTMILDLFLQKNPSLLKK